MYRCFVKIISSQNQEGTTETTAAALIATAAQDNDCLDFFKQLHQTYELADSLDGAHEQCRKCGSCCHQENRHLEVFAVEIGYMLHVAKDNKVPLIDYGHMACPMRTRLKACRNYEGRPLGCRLFLPWEEWTEEQGCTTFPHSQEGFSKIGNLVNFTEQLNQEFVFKTGLFRNLDFDFLSHWSVLQWFFALQAS